jgi:hypothetical protein
MAAKRQHAPRRVVRQRRKAVRERASPASRLREVLRVAGLALLAWHLPLMAAAPAWRLPLMAAPVVERAWLP